MAKGFKHGAGGGTPLNFKVVGGTTAPSNAKENAIWINTSTAITSYVFSATQPTKPVAGMVWITIGTSSAVAFSATKKNPIMVYPLSAKQYIGGAWVDKTAKIYQGGAWAAWWSGMLYYQGNEYTEFTGGIVADSTTRLTKNATTLNIGFNGSNTGDTGVSTVKPIDITAHKFLKAVIDKVNFGNTPNSFHMRLYKDGSEVAALNSVKQAGEVSIDISNLTGLHTFRLGVYRYTQSAADIDVSKWWLER